MNRSIQGAVSLISVAGVFACGTERSVEASRAAHDDAPTTQSVAALRRGLRAAAHDIAVPSDNSADSSFAFLEPLLRKTRLVLLGESSHGIAEFSVEKARLIRFLHRRLGFDVVAFEAPMYSCEAANASLARTAPTASARACLYGIWYVGEVLPLFEQLRASRRTLRPMHLTGMDVQVISGPVSVERPAFLRNVVGRIDARYASRVFRLDSTVLAALFGGDPPSVREWTATATIGTVMERQYDSLASWLTDHRHNLARQGVSRREFLIARQLARAGATVVRIAMAPPGEAQANLRDRAMADNLDFLLDSLYPGRKIVVWAHNEHIRYGPEGDSGVPFLDARIDGAWQRVGTWINARRRAETYSIGLYMHEGRHRISRTLATVGPLDSASFEGMMHAEGFRRAIVDLREWSSHLPVGALRAAVPTYIWGQTKQSLILPDQYDALLFVNKVTVPHRLGLVARPLPHCCPRLGHGVALEGTTPEMK